MKTKGAAAATQNKHIVYIALAVVGILLVPFVAMQITDEIVWGLGDFVIAGTLLFGAGLGFELAARKTQSAKHRVIIGAAIAAALLVAWAELAVGIFD